MKYTVLLLRPDYATDNFGQDTCQLHVESCSLTAAIEQARLVARRMDNLPDTSDLVGELEDYFVIAAYQGHLEDINPGE